jgi:hypothetical protein
MIILNHQVPNKPVYGAKCNDCGVYCAAGACKALQWHEADQQYQCGILIEPKRYLGKLPKWLSPLISKWCAQQCPKIWFYLSLGFMLLSPNYKLPNFNFFY